MKPTITIEYCPKRGWLLRAAYMAQELLTTFTEDLSSVSLKPSKVAGRYTIFVDKEVLFDRKENGGFSDIKEIKRQVRDRIAPQKNLGHTDR